MTATTAENQTKTSSRFGGKRKNNRISLGASKHTEPIIGSSPFASILDAVASTPMAAQLMQKPLPVEPNNGDLPLPPLPLPVQASLDVNVSFSRQQISLDAACHAHIRSLLRQALESSFLLPVPWEDILFVIAMNLADNVPRSLAIIDNIKLDNDNSSNTAEEVDSSSDGPSSVGSGSAKRPHRFLVTILDVEGDRPENSKFVHGQFDGRPIFRHDNSRGLIDPDVSLVGGTIVLHGDRRELSKAMRIMELLAYVVCSLALEMHLLRDHHALRSREDVVMAELRAEARDGISTTSSKKKGRKLLGKDLLSGTPRLISGSGSSSPTHLKRASTPGASIWNWLVGRGQNEERASGSATPIASRELHTSHSANLSINSSNNNGGGNNNRHYPFHAHRPSSASSSSSTTKIPATRELQPPDLSASTVSLELRGSNRFARILHQMERAVLSTSPDVIFPPPHLLQRLRREEEEDERADHEAYAVSPVNSSFMAGGSLEQLLASAAIAPNSLPSPGPLTSPFDTRRGRGTVISSRSSRGISIDAKAGLSYLATNNNSLEGVFRHQSLTFLYSNYWSATASSSCQPTELRTIDYYQREASDHQADQTLAEFIYRMRDEANLLCPEPGCGRKMLSHIASYVHGPGRVNVTIEETKAPLPTGVDYNRDRNAITMWTRCRICEATTPMTLMSPATQRYSFGKYLELLLYNPRFICQLLCSHAQSRELLIRCFRVGQHIIRVDYEAVDLFEMRVPRIQVDPELALLPATRELLRRDDQPDPDEALQMLEQLRLDIAQFYGSAKCHITLLEEFTGVEACERGEGTLEQVCCQTMLEEITTDFRREEFELYEEARLMDACELNDIRRAFKIRSQAAITRVNLWRKVHADGCKAEANEAWKLPEYVESPLAHVFPGSRIIVRENEPSSIIAYTLSARAFQQALAELGTPPPSPDEEVALINGQHYYGDDGFDHDSYMDPNYAHTIATEEESDYGASVAATSYFASTFNDTQMYSPSHADTQSRMQPHRIEGDDAMLHVKTWPTSEIYSPHLKMKFSEGNMKFSCVVYYAAQFDQLRRKCGVNNIYLQSLARCDPWSAQGGKSQSTFFKTKDDRLVVKQMLNNWTVAEKDALLKFAPSYFNYMDQSSQNPSVLAKIFGFYTVKYKNVHTGKTMKMDLLKFDLKGIPERYVDLHKSSSETLWDGDWVEGSYRSVLMTYGHSKTIIRESIRNDTRFLAESNVMDYSLLVDFIGTYNWYKRIESRSKSTLRLTNSTRQVTVVPPEQYKTRFRDGMEQYFLSVPDKWIKTSNSITSTSGKSTTSTLKLPSVL
ncbi:hypothetical protein BDF19DRAFT_425524 [Syncephalis fuscata]|nr:hypothetical protein BDF19DRAFT_425524 [Syncephalis fuscata]